MENNSTEMMSFDVIQMFKNEVDMVQEDLVAMEFALEDYFETKIGENIIYFNASPAQLYEHNNLLLEQLIDLEQDFIKSEEFEKCAVVVKVKEVIQQKINEANNFSTD